MWDLLPEGSFAERERAILDLTEKNQKELTKRDLQHIADSFGERVQVGGKTYKRYQSAPVRYHSLGGDLVVVWDSYREEGVRNGPTVVPLELVAGLTQRATPALARNVVHGYARHDMRTHGEILREAHRIPPSRATLERMAKALAKDASEKVEKVEALAFGQESVPVGTVGSSIGFERVSVPMAEKLPANEAKSTLLRRKKYVRAVPAPMAVNWRMAFVGTVTLVDKHSEAIAVTRYASTAEDDPSSLTARMRRQVDRALQQSPGLQMGIVQDGAPEMWTLMRELLQPLQDNGSIKTWHEAIDLPHLMERLSQAFKVALGSSSSVLAFWKLRLLESNDTIDLIEATLKRRLPALADEDAATLQKHLTYIENNKDRMRYATMQKVSLPIGSGVTESTAKNVVNMRAKRSGQRWSVPGLRGVLNIRALLKSERLGRFWEVLSRRYVTPVTNLPAFA